MGKSCLSQSSLEPRNKADLFLVSPWSTQHSLGPQRDPSPVGGLELLNCFIIHETKNETFCEGVFKYHVLYCVCYLINAFHPRKMKQMLVLFPFYQYKS